MVNRRIQSEIYKLKRFLGSEIFVWEESSSTDYETGTITPSRLIHRIRRAVLLPEKMYRRYLAHITRSMQAGGGAIETAMRAILVDNADIPIILQPGLNVLIKTRLHVIQEVHDFQGAATIIMISGTPQSGIYALCFDFMTMRETVV